jgi:5,10-methylenetetrahydromethanopterin reductase
MAAMIGFGFFVQDVPTALDQVQRADRAGVDTAWMVMNPLSWDTPTLAAAALARTERIRVGTSIVPMFTRHPLALATQAATLSGVAPGRFRLGVGTGNMGIMAEGYGTPVTQPVARTREYLQVLRSTLVDGAVERTGAFYDVAATLVPGKAAASTELTLAALGPRMFALAGEVAGAAMSWNCPVAYLDEVARPALAKGAADAGRPAPPLITHVTAVVTTDRATARDAARPMVRLFGKNPQYAAMFAKAGLPLAEDGTPSDALVDAVVVSGDEAGLTDQLGELVDGQDELLVTLEPASDTPAGRRDDEDVLFRAITNVTGRAA